uniref:Uncharacterized protein n=1 Tax=Cucumis melo TaxID=3656 RepID=A0A9I9E707_CUCME
MIKVATFIDEIFNPQEEFQLTYRLHWRSQDFGMEWLKATKWSEKKGAIAELTKLASTKKIASSDFSEVCRTSKKV